MTESDQLRAEIERLHGLLDRRKRGRVRHKPRDHIRVLTVEQVRDLLEHAKSLGGFEHALVAVGYHFGLRAGEYGLIRRRDIHLADRGPHAPHGEILIHAEKDSVSQTQPIVPDLVDLRPILRTWMHEQDESILLFPSPRDSSRGISRQMVFWHMRRIAARAGIPPRAAYPHILKASLASHLFARGADLKFVQYWLRHKSMNSTMKYLHMTESQREKGMAALSSIGVAKEN